MSPGNPLWAAYTVNSCEHPGLCLISETSIQGDDVLAKEQAKFSLLENKSPHFFRLFQEVLPGTWQSVPGYDEGESTH